MSTEMTNLVAESAQWINAAAPKLEKLAQLEIERATFAKQLAEKMASVGLISKDELTKTANDLASSSLERALHAFDLLAARRSTGMGKAASFASTHSKPLTADEAFEKALGINNS